MRGMRSFLRRAIVDPELAEPIPGGGSPLTVQGVPPEQVRVMAIHFVGRFFSRNPRYLDLGVRSQGSPAHAQQVCFGVLF